MTVRNIYSAAQKRTETQNFITTQQVRKAIKHCYIHSRLLKHKYLSSNRDCSWYVAMWCHHFPVRIVCGRIKNTSIWCTSWFHAEEHSTPFPAPYVSTCPLYVAILSVLILIICSAGYICYDDGCHLRRFAQNLSRKDLTPTTNKIASIEIVVDKMHITGHTDKWCLENCDARKYPDLSDVSYR